MASDRRVIVIGAGGQAREVRFLLEELQRAGERFAYSGLVVSEPALLGERDSKEDVLGDLSFLRKHRDRFDALAIGIGAPEVRLRISAELEPEFGPELWPALVHPSVIFDRKSCQLAHGVHLFPGIVGTVNLRFGPHSMVNNGCTIGHEASIGRGCVINPGANISGGVVIEDGALVGTGAQVLQYRTIGRRARVGAGAVVTGDVAPGCTVVGVPARATNKELT